MRAVTKPSARKIDNRIVRAAAYRVEALEARMLLTALTIAQENALPGAPQSQWDVSGAGDATLQGFATDISVNQGQTVSFKINDTAKASYHIDIYRMGYYQGNGARLVTSIPSSQTLKLAQPAPISDATTGLVDCGNWAVSASWSVPSDATSGIYFAKLIRDDTGGSSHVVFVVRNDASHSALLFQTSDASWEAYNTWGPSGLFSGNSLYEENGNTNLRAYKVSYNRPFTDRGISGGLGSDNWVFHAEYPMVRWLEANGYDVTYFTDMDSDRLGSLIKNHNVFMSVGHDEYWSGGQRTNVEAARDAGINLAFFSGNEIFWKTRWENSIDGTNTSYRTLVCYKETHANAVIDPMDPPTWTGTWMDPRFSPPADGGRPQNALSGTLFTVNRGPSDLGTSFTVPFADSRFRFWRNTSVASLTSGQTATIGDFELGYEWDEDIDNGFRPAGLIDMSSTTQNVTQKFIDYGNTVAAGVATHSLTLYRAPSGALVFGAGTVQWSWGLDGNHDDGSSSPDVRVKQATVNLLADMGAQPATLQSGLVAASASTDTVAPTSTITFPTANLTVQGGTSYTITGTASDAGGGVVAGVEVSTDGGATWHPATGRNTWSYTWYPNGLAPVTIKSRATDDSGNTEIPSAGVPVNVTGPISVWSATTVPLSPDDSDTAATELGVKFRSDVPGYIEGIRFYKGPTNTGTHIGDLWNSTGTRLATATFSGESASGWQTVRFTNPVPINANTTYVAAYHTNVGQYAEDDGYFNSSGYSNSPLHALASGVDGPNGVYGYSTGSVFPTITFQNANYYVDVLFDVTANDTTPPTVTNKTPAAGATNVGVTVSPTVTFSEPVQQATISFVVKDAGGNAAPGAVTYSGSTNIATFTPSTSLTPTTTYTATVSGAKDLAGNVMTAVSWSFTTAAPIGAGPYSIWSPSAAPVTADDNDPSATEVGVKFRTDLAGTISGIRFYKGTLNTGTHIGDLWSSTGTKLATATFSGETASGWQQVNFTTPVAIQANTTYIAAYHTNVGQYAEDDNFFVNGGVDTGPLHALQAGVDGFNGVYAYGASSVFPNQNFLSANYWVDVVFNPNVTDTTPPTVTSQTPAPNATNIATSTTVVAVFSESVQSSTISFVLRDASGNQIPAGVSYNDATHTATLTPSSSLAAGAIYTATVSGAKDQAGNVMTAPVTWSFTTAAADVTPPTVTAQTPAPNSTNVAVTTTVTATFSEAVQPATISFVLKDNTGLQVAATVSYNSTNRTATLTPSASLTLGKTYTATVSGVADLAGNVMTTPVSWSFTTVPPDTTPPSVTGQTPAPNATNVITNTTVTVTFSEAIQASTLSFVLKDPNGNVVASTVAYDNGTLTATLTPTTSLGTSSTYTATVSGAADLSGNVMSAPVSWSFTTVPAVGTGPFSIWGASAAPTVTADTDSSSVEIGVKFRSDVPGYITAIRFYKGSGNSGTHVGHLWTTAGALLGSATFSGETATGWQQVSFSSPVAISANTTYIASYFAPAGHYAADNGFFAGAGVDNAPLHALADGTDGGDGVYVYSTAGAFPTQTFSSTNYWVDVVFTTTNAPVVTSQSPASGATGVALGSAVTATFSQAIQQSTLSFLLMDAAGNVVPSTVTFNSTTLMATLAPTAALNASTTYTAFVSGAKNANGDVMTPVAWSFTTAASSAWVQTTNTDFNGGTLGGTQVTNNSGGEVQLNPSFSDDFTGSALSSSWTTSSWTSAGGGPTSVTVASSAVSILGAQLLSATTAVATPAEGRVTISAGANERFGLATNLATAAGNYWAVFTTNTTTNTLYAEVNINGTTTDTKIGTLSTAYHVYLIKPTATGFQFYVDGALKQTVNGTFPTGTPLRIVMSAFKGSPSPAMKVDWARFDSYPASGTFVSGVFDASRVATWGTASWTTTLPAGTSILVETSTGNTATPDSSWSAWQAVSNGGTIASPPARYIRYRITLITSDPTQTPMFLDITLNWS